MLVSPPLWPDRQNEKPAPDPRCRDIRRQSGRAVAPLSWLAGRGDSVTGAGDALPRTGSLLRAGRESGLCAAACQRDSSFFHVAFLLADEQADADQRAGAPGPG